MKIENIRKLVDKKLKQFELELLKISCEYNVEIIIDGNIYLKEEKK